MPVCYSKIQGCATITLITVTFLLIISNNPSSKMIHYSILNIDLLCRLYLFEDYYFIHLTHLLYYSMYSAPIILFLNLY